MGHPISADTVRKELVKLGFSRPMKAPGIPIAARNSNTSTQKSSRRRQKASL